MISPNLPIFNEAVMEGSLPTMDVHLPSTFSQEQSKEEMKQLLLCAALELEQAHEAKLRHQEAQMRHLKDALFKVAKERDVYRDKCNQLQARLSRSPSLGSGLSDDITMNLSSVQQMEVSSLAEPIVGLSQMQCHIQGHQQQIDFSSLEIQQQLEQELELPHHHLVDLAIPDDNDHQIAKQRLEHLQQQLEMDREEQESGELTLDVHSPDRQSGNAQVVESQNTAILSTNPWQEFDSASQMKLHSDHSCPLIEEPAPLHMNFRQAVSSVHVDQHSSGLGNIHEGFQLQQQRQDPAMLLAQAQHQLRITGTSHLLSEEQPCHSALPDVGGHPVPVSQHSQWQRVPQSPYPLLSNGIGSSPTTNVGTVPSFSVASPSAPGAHTCPSLLQNGSAVASILSPLERFGDSPSSSITPVRTMHLPEPPEANVKVLLSSLPEKGKLLQAVMQAGPTLQTLMLAAPLPQWRHPPPALDSLEIPRVSMNTTNLSVPSPERTLAVNGMLRNGSSLSHGMRLSSSVHVSPSVHASGPNGYQHSKALSVPDLPSISEGFDTYNSLNPPLRSQRSFPQMSHITQRTALSNSYLSHDVSLLGPPLKYAKIH